MSKEKKISQEEILAAIRKMVRTSPNALNMRSGLNMRAFLASSGLRHWDIHRHFTSWNQALEAAGIKIARQTNPYLQPEQMLEDWGLVVRKLQRLPSHLLYDFHGKFCSRTLNVRFGGWRNVRAAFHEFAKDRKEWADVAKFCDTEPQEKRGHALRPRRPTAPKLRRDRPVFGKPLAPLAMGHAPTSEGGVILLFGMLAERLGFHILSVQPGFPDCSALRKMGDAGWQNVAIEFEFESCNFHKHGHAPNGCDIIVCWEHNWTDCPAELEVIALRDMIGRFGAGGAV